MTHRIEPTPEDLAIVERNIARLVRWTVAAAPTKYDGPSIARLVAVMRTCTGDYLEFPPYGSVDDSATLHCYP